MSYTLASSHGIARMATAVGEAPALGETVGLPAPGRTSARSLGVEVVDAYPHDVWAFTQGLCLHGDMLLESTGLYQGFSTVRDVRLPWGHVRRAVPLAAEQFGEGIAVRDGQIVQLTYREGLALVYDLATFVPVHTYSYSGEGWGLAFDGQRFVMSDGSGALVFRDPGTFAVTETVSVTLDGSPVEKLNELECVGDVVYANIFPSATILQIARDGRVTGVIDASTLLTPEERRCLGQGIPTLQRAAVLNGIAYDMATETFLLSGKLWPKVFRVRFVPQEGT
jgi:glutaminyl-peptide cyclotransferase